MAIEAVAGGPCSFSVGQHLSARPSENKAKPNGMGELVGEKLGNSGPVSGCSVKLGPSSVRFHGNFEPTWRRLAKSRLMGYRIQGLGFAPAAVRLQAVPGNLSQLGDAPLLSLGSGRTGKRMKGGGGDVVLCFLSHKPASKWMVVVVVGI